MAEDSGEKIFDATPHRRQQARDKGQVAFSQDLGSAALLLVAALVLRSFGGAVVTFCAGLMQRNLGEVIAYTADRQTMLSLGKDMGMGLAGVMLPILGMFALAGVVSSVFQVGFLFVPSRLQPDISRLSILGGIKRIFSAQGAAKLGFGLFKVMIVAAVSSAVLWARMDEVMQAGAMEIPQLAWLLTDVTLTTLLWVGVALFVLALADFAFQKWKNEQEMKMTHQEMKEEMKNMQGDPHVAARRKQVQRQMALDRMGESVPQADVVVTNPTELAIALRYDAEKMLAPVVVAKGAGIIAQRIRRLALENNVPIVERKPLAQLLFKEVDVNHPVPDNSYAAVAEVLAYVYELKGKKPPKMAG